MHLFISYMYKWSILDMALTRTKCKISPNPSREQNQNIEWNHTAAQCNSSLPSTYAYSIFCCCWMHRSILWLIWMPVDDQTVYYIEICMYRFECVYFLLLIITEVKSISKVGFCWLHFVRIDHFQFSEAKPNESTLRHFDVVFFF